MAPPVTRARTIADRYELGDVIGSGGMGEVRQAHDRRLRRAVAVKLLHPDLSADGTARARFEQEGRAAARINHPNVVEVYDIGEDEGVPYIVMECLPGRTLGDELRKGRIPIDRARQVAIDVLTALEAAHRLGVVHRDVKPGNILFAADDRAQLADFGIAKAAESADLTAAGFLIGTPHYLPPERLRGEPATAEGDVFSLGVVLYESLAGHRPYAGTTPSTLMESMKQPAASIGAVRPDVDEELGNAVDRAIAVDAADRFTSAAEMRDAITPTAFGPTASLAPTIVGGSDPTIVAESTRVARAPLMATAPATDVAVPRPTPPLPPPPRPGRPRQRRRRRTFLALFALVACLAIALAAVAMASAGRQDPVRTSITPTVTTPLTTSPATTPVPITVRTTLPGPPPPSVPTTEPPTTATTAVTTTAATDPSDSSTTDVTSKQARRKGAKDDHRP